jgi:uncharacterized membrane protein YcaP (DUF421 family)
MLQGLLKTVLQATFAYLLLMTVTRLIGRKTISEMTFFNFAAAITLGTLAATVGMGTNTSSSSAAAVMITFGALTIVTGYLHIKGFGFRKLVNSEPVTLIKNGEIVKDNMQRTRTSIESLNALLREKNVFNIADVEFAIMETDGKLSVLPKSQKQPVTPSDLNIPTNYKGLTKDIIIDGNIMYENLKDANLDEQWLKDQLKSKGIKNVQEVFFAALDTSGRLYVSKGLNGKEKPGQYGIE